MKKDTYEDEYGHRHEGRHAKLDGDEEEEELST